MKLNSNNQGIAAEQQALAFLKKQGMALVTSNYSCRYGEIDLIMRDDRTLVFVEVRLRSNQQFASAAHSIDARKQQKLIRTAQFYMQQHDVESSCRFDVVLFNDKISGQAEWIRNAIDA